MQEDPVHPFGSPPLNARSRSSLSSSQEDKSPGITPTANIGRMRFADFLKKSRRDNKSLLSCPFIGKLIIRYYD